MAPPHRASFETEKLASSNGGKSDKAPLLVKESKSPLHGIVLIAACLSALGGLFFGYSTGVIAGALSSLEETFGTEMMEEMGPTLSDQTEEFITAATILGAALGSFLAGPLCDIYGRKPTAILVSLLGLGSTIYLALAPNIPNVIVARLLVGFPVGMFTFVAPLYSSETSPPEYRGTLGTIFGISLGFGIFVSYLINLAFANVTDGWRYMFGLDAIIAGTSLFLSVLLMPRSPRWLVAHGRKSEARESLAQIVGEKNVDDEISNIEESMNKNESSWRDVFLAREMVKPLFIGLVLAVGNQLVGINAIIYYAPTIFANAGFDDDSQQIGITAGVGFWFFLCSFLAARFSDRFGRRKLMLTGLVIAFIGNAIIAIAFLLLENTPLAILAIICILIFIAGYQMGPGPLFFVVMSEIYPESVRGTAMSFINGVQWLLNLVISLTFLTVNNAIGGGPTFFIFAGFCVVTWLGLYFTLPETQGKTLDEIQAEMNGIDVKIETTKGTEYV